MNFAGAVSCIEATIQTLQDMRTEEEWQKIWERAVSLANTHSSTQGQEEATDCLRDSKTWLQQLKLMLETEKLHWKSNVYNCIILC